MNQEVPSIDCLAQISHILLSTDDNVLEEAFLLVQQKLLERLKRKEHIEEESRMDERHQFRGGGEGGYTSLFFEKEKEWEFPKNEECFDFEMGREQSDIMHISSKEKVCISSFNNMSNAVSKVISRSNSCASMDGCRFLDAIARIVTTDDDDFGSADSSYRNQDDLEPIDCGGIRWEQEFKFNLDAIARIVTTDDDDFGSADSSYRNQDDLEPIDCGGIGWEQEFKFNFGGLTKAMKTTMQSTTKLEQWDRTMGLKKSDCRTMMNSSRSRKIIRKMLKKEEALSWPPDL